MKGPIISIREIGSVNEPEVQAAIQRLPEWRREQALKFKFLQGRAECAMSYLLLCDMLQEHYGILQQPTFDYGEHGKPILVEHPDIHFNISHCKAGIACAASDAPVGIDIECMGRFSDSLARYTLCDEEYQRVITAESPDLEFTRLWTQKEAVVKLTGRGIDDDIKYILYKNRHVNICTIDNIDGGFVYSYSFL